MSLDRDRKMLFNEVAQDYDRYRPRHPDRAFDDMEKLSSLSRSSRLLEIGCGTGQATTSMAQRGYAIDAVELGTELASLATQNLRAWPSVRVHNVAFESFPVDSADYDLVYCAQAFHWIDPEIRLQRTARALRAGGSFCLLNNFTRPQEGALKELAERLQETTGEIASTTTPERETNRWLEELQGSDLFGEVTVRRYPWSASHSADEYVGLYRTYSNFLSLTNDLWKAAEEAIRAVVQVHGGEVEREYVCVLFHTAKMA